MLYYKNDKIHWPLPDFAHISTAAENNLKSQEHRSKKLLEVKSCADLAVGIPGTALVNQEMPQEWIVSVLMECLILRLQSLRQSRAAAES